MTSIQTPQTRPLLNPNDIQASATRTSAEGFDIGDRKSGVESAPSDRRLVAEAWHALRRRWLLTVTVGGVVGAVAAICVWFGTSRQYTATAVLRISAGRSTVLNATDRGEGAATFDILKRTQRQYIRSPHILNSVLQREQVASKLKNGPSDPLTWLQQTVSVSYPDDAEIMNVSVRTDDRDLSEALANTIVDVYLDDVNEAERRQKMDHMTDLEKAYSEGQENLRKKRMDVHAAADALGTNENQGLTVSQQNAVQELMSAWTQLNQIDFELIKSDSVRKSSTDGNPANLATGLSSEEELKSSSDPVILSLTAQQEHIQAGIEEHRGRFSDNHPSFKKLLAEKQPELDRIREKIEKRRVAQQKEFANRMQSAQAATSKYFKMSFEALSEQKKLLTKRVDELKGEVKKIARPSVDVELLQAEVKAIEEIQNYIQRELHDARVEVANPKPRTSRLNKAVVPQGDAVKNHLEFCGLTGAAGFFASGALVVAWDLRRRRLNSAAEVAQLLRLKLLGTVPPISSRDDATAVADYAMDAIAATIAFSTPEESHRLLLVTSAAPGEGKTTVAAGLAMSLARMGRPTVLVDFDLQCPLLHEMFGLDLTPGIADVLAERLEPTDAARPTSIDNLSVVAAGLWPQRGFADWCNDRLKRILAELRLNYAHVVIDTAPLLPSVETRLLVPHVDGVVISMLRDVSEISRIRAGCDMLHSYDACVLGAVMVGAPSERYQRRKSSVMQVANETSPGSDTPRSSPGQESLAEGSLGQGSLGEAILGEGKAGEAILGEENVFEASQESDLRR
jgi:succinoglycan biosynthesis transport protein ExoP